jgi:hypothetical protein
MFRRGGSSQGTGITSGLERQKFQEAGPAVTDVDRQKAIIDYVSKLKQEAQPTTKQRIGDFLTAFGASKGPDLGSSLGSAAAGYSQLSAAREARADKYGMALDQKLLEMFAGDKESLNSFLKTVKARAENEVVKGTYSDYDTAYKAVFDEVYQDMYKGQRKEKSFYDLVEDRAKIYLNNEELKTFDQARNYAEVRIKIEKGDIKIDKVPIGAISTSKSGVSDITITNDGKAAGPNTNKPGYKPNAFAKKYRVNENYVDPITKSVFQYQGGGMFKRVYP